MLTRALVVLACLAALGAAAAAECPKKLTGKPIYRERQTPVSGDEAAVTFEIFATGRWRRVESVAASAVEPTEQSGCAPATVMRELTRALGRARFRADRSGPTCDAVPTARVVYEAPRRRRKVTVDRPCGAPLDLATQQLIACAQVAMQAEVSAEDARAWCRAAAP